MELLDLINMEMQLLNLIRKCLSEVAGLDNWAAMDTLRDMVILIDKSLPGPSDDVETIDVGDSEHSVVVPIPKTKII